MNVVLYFVVTKTKYVIGKFWSQDMIQNPFPGTPPKDWGSFSWEYFDKVSKSHFCQIPEYIFYPFPELHCPCMSENQKYLAKTMTFLFPG